MNTTVIDSLVKNPGRTYPELVELQAKEKMA
ncbi:hypothetical protein C4K26_3225 [Pseudomonas chlororaphis]|nr:hypothetical protein C4K26_3225 [Pseudomonas chlororaphis]